MRWFIRVVSGINSVIGKILRFLLVPLMAIICFDVIARYVFNSPTEWAQELNTYILCFYAILGGGYVMLKGGHVSVELLYDRFSLRTKAVLSCITSVYFFVFVWVVLWYGWDMAISAFHDRETSGALMDWPIYPAKFVVPVAALLLLLQGVVKLIFDIETAVTGKVPEDMPKTEGMFDKKE